MSQFSPAPCWQIYVVEVSTLADSRSAGWRRNINTKCSTVEYVTYGLFEHNGTGVFDPITEVDFSQSTLGRHLKIKSPKSDKNRLVFGLSSQLSFYHILPVYFLRRPPTNLNSVLTDFVPNQFNFLRRS